MDQDAELRALPVDELVDRVGIVRAYPLKHVASLLFTYRCSIACRHCLFSCRPGLPDIAVSHDDGLEFLRQLRATDRVVHIAGGEAMLYWDRLLALCEAAGREGVAPHFFETNASWCRADDEVHDRYRRLQDTGLKGVLISADPYHQAFVPPDRRERAYRLAVEVYGVANVAAGDLSLDRLAELRAIGRDDARVGEYARANPPRLVGRAAESLARHFPDRPLRDLSSDRLWHGVATDVHCGSEFDPAEMWEIHIDPYGNLQTCCGIIVGNAHLVPLPEQLRRGFHTANDLVRRVYEQGPFGLLELALERGYEPLPGYKQKCHLCWETRQFLRPAFPETFGPAEVYDLGEPAAT